MSKELERLVERIATLEAEIAKRKTKPKRAIGYAIPIAIVGSLLMLGGAVRIAARQRAIDNAPALAAPSPSTGGEWLAHAAPPVASQPMTELVFVKIHSEDAFVTIYLRGPARELVAVSTRTLQTIWRRPLSPNLAADAVVRYDPQTREIVVSGNPAEKAIGYSLAMGLPGDLRELPAPVPEPREQPVDLDALKLKAHGPVRHFAVHGFDTFAVCADRILVRRQHGGIDELIDFGEPER